MTTERHAAAKLAAPTINLASVVYGLDAYMRSRGADAGDALRRAGLEPGDLTDPDRRVPLIRYLELLEFCADLLADPQFGLKFGAQYEPRHAGVVGNVALASRTIGEAFETIGRYLPTMVDATVHGVEVSDGIAFVYFYYIDPLMMSYRQKGDWAIAVGPRRRSCCRSWRTKHRRNAAPARRSWATTSGSAIPGPASGLTPACSSDR
jgi:Arabinose-binding domain of AraC transcription regulator, N-term